MLPASLQQVELELLAAAGAGGSGRELGACFANLPSGSQLCQATEMVKNGCGVCPYSDQPPDVHLPPDLSGGLGACPSIPFVLECAWAPELRRARGVRSFMVIATRCR